MLDFDNNVCCVTLSPINIYVCLICGKAYQGRGESTPAYLHSLEDLHQLFINTTTGTIHCLPDDYEVEDNSLMDIKYNLFPIYTNEYTQKIDKEMIEARSLEG